MKPINAKKLTLLKATISNLQEKELDKVRGGRPMTAIVSECCDLETLSCAASCQSINPNCKWTDTCF